MFAIRPNGTLWSWGSAGYGQNGLGNTTYYSSPKQIGALADWQEISTNGTSQTVIARKTDGTLWAWGRNGNGQLGLGDTTDRSSPVQIGALTTWSAIGQSCFSAFAINLSWMAFSSSSLVLIFSVIGLFKAYNLKK
jgi:alpha-tubulin suppressor-like RCC1 family protein